jgi:hypothetical protein
MKCKTSCNIIIIIIIIVITTIIIIIGETALLETAFLPTFCNVRSGFRFFRFRNQIFFHRARSSALRPFPGTCRTRSPYLRGDVVTGWPRYTPRRRVSVWPLLRISGILIRRRKGNPQYVKLVVFSQQQFITPQN